MLEKATGPDRELDIAIYVFDSAQEAVDHVKAPAYTASVEIAVTLVPSQFEWTVAQNDGLAFVWEPVGPYQRSQHKRLFQGTAATHAIALCIAALKARQS